jgi:uncharacterized protein YqeY
MLDINAKIMEAMKSKNKIASETFKLIKAKILEFKTQKNAPEYTEEAEIKLLQKMVKEREESAKIYNEAGRTELADAELAQAAVINDLLPKLASKEDVELYLNEYYPNGIEKKSMGVVIKEVKSAFVGVDGSMVAQCVKTKIVS